MNNMDVDLSTKDGQEKAVLDHLPYLKSCFSYKLKGDPNAEDLALELTQDAFVKIHDSIMGGNGPKKAVKSWLSRVATSVFFDSKRRKKARRNINGEPYEIGNPYDDIPDEITDDDRIQNYNERRVEAIKGVVDKLPSAQQEVIELIIKEPGLSGKEAASKLKINRTAYQMNKQRARINLEKALSGINLDI